MGRRVPSHKERGVLRSDVQRGGRPGAALLLSGAVLVVPLLLIQNGPAAQASARSAAHASAPVTRVVRVHVTRVVTRRSPPLVPAPRSSKQAITTTSARRPARAARPVQAPVLTVEPIETMWPAAPVRAVVSATAATSTTTTTPTVRTAASGPAPVVAGAVSGHGQVTYYAHPAGRCASPWLSFGTVVEVTNPANGESVTCVVDDREADTARSIDLATATFAEIAPLSQGVVDADLSW